MSQSLAGLDVVHFRFASRLEAIACVTAVSPKCGALNRRCALEGEEQQGTAFCLFVVVVSMFLRARCLHVAQLL